MTRRFALWRARMRLAAFALTRYMPIGGADDAPPADPPKDPPKDPPADPPADKTLTLTQAQLDKLIQDRVARAKPADYDDAKKKADAFDKLQQSQKSDLDKANERADQAEKAAAERTKQADERLRRAAVLEQATQQKAIKPEHLFKLIDADKVTVGDDGQVTGAEDAVKSFLEANPEYVGSTRSNGNADQGARGGGANQLKSTDGMSPDEIAKAVSEGRLNDYLKSPK